MAATRNKNTPGNYALEIQGKTEQAEYKVYENDTIYDDFYADIYDYLVFNNLKDDYEVGYIMNSASPSSKSKILDVGCGTGHHVASLAAKNLEVIGVDVSPSMIKKAKEQYPQDNFMVGNALNGNLFKMNSLTHILCLYFT
ncbi:class I SAM-dependent methyltransferase, partial [bacterium]|nr:class I SAM-dependent methyltransferase [bacterium]